MKTLVLLIKVYRMRPLLGLSDEPHCWRIPYVLQNFNAQARVKKNLKFYFGCHIELSGYKFTGNRLALIFFPKKWKILASFITIRLDSRTAQAEKVKTTCMSNPRAKTWLVVTRFFF